MVSAFWQRQCGSVARESSLVFLCVLCGWKGSQWLPLAELKESRYKIAMSAAPWLTAARVLALTVLATRAWFVYKRARRAPKRSPRIQRIEIRIAIALWGLIGIAVVVLLLIHHND